QLPHVVIFDGDARGVVVGEERVGSQVVAPHGVVGRVDDAVVVVVAWDPLGERQVGGDQEFEIGVGQASELTVGGGDEQLEGRAESPLKQEQIDLVHPCWEVDGAKASGRQIGEIVDGDNLIVDHQTSAVVGVESKRHVTSFEQV